MNANKLIAGFVVASAIAFVPFSVYAVQGLNASGNAKVDNAMAKRWSEQAKGQKTPTDEKRVVNFGSKKNGDCNVNVGTAQPSGRNGRPPKDIVVTTKEVINVCK